MRALVMLSMLLGSGVVFTACGTPAAKCSESNCSGFCDASGQCQISGSDGGSAGTFSLTAPTSLATGFTTTNEVRINRSSGAAGDLAVAFSLLGGCTATTTSPVTFAAGSFTSIPIVLTTPAATGSCTVSITPQSPGTSGNPNTSTISIVDPIANVTFAFLSSSPIAARVGGAPVQVTVNRSGETNGDFTVPVTFSGTLTSGGVVITGAGATAPAGPSANLSFPANSSSATITYTPPTTTPAVPGLPSSLVMALGTPAGGVSGQTGTASGSHTLTLDGPGCPAETNAMSLGPAGLTTLTRMPPGAVATYVLPTLPSARYAGDFVLSETTTSFPTDPYVMEIHINKCKGLVQPTPGNSCYRSTSTQKALFNKTWWVSFFGRLTTPEMVNAAGHCWAPPSEGPWYVNIRYTYSDCTSGGNCGWHAQWN